MSRFTKDDRVRIDIPDSTDPDHDKFHGVHGTVVEILQDDLDKITGNHQDEKIYRVELESGAKVDFRSRDLRPPIK